MAHIRLCTKEGLFKNPIIRMFHHIHQLHPGDRWSAVSPFPNLCPYGDIDSLHGRSCLLPAASLSRRHAATVVSMWGSVTVLPPLLGS